MIKEGNDQVVDGVKGNELVLKLGDEVILIYEWLLKKDKDIESE